MNALAAVDKLAPNECLLAENVRLDETGNIAISGAYSRQNTAAYLSSASASNVQSLFFNPSIGGVAGIGKDVFIGQNLANLVNSLSGVNANGQKMSFASAPNRVYFDVGSVGYWTDMTNLLTVDWAPPTTSAAVMTTASGTFTGANAETFGFTLATASTMLGVAATGAIVGTFANLVSTGGPSSQVTMTGIASLLVAGAVVGTSSSVIGPTFTVLANSQVVETATFTWGNQTSLWGYPALTAAQMNLANSGFQVSLSFSYVGGHVAESSLPKGAGTPQIIAYQNGAGMVSGTGTTGTLTGTYTWKVTFVATNGEESDASAPTIATTLSGNQGTLTAIPTSDARTASRNVYRKGGFLTSYYLVGSIPDNVTTTYSDNQTDIAALAQGSILAGDVPGDFPNSRLGNQMVRFPCYHYDRVFWVNAVKPNQILWSKPLNGFAYPVINVANVGDSKPISGLVSIFGELIIIKTDSIWVLTGTDESSFSLSRTPSSQGTDIPFSIVALPDKIIFANRIGLWMFNGYTSVAVTTKLDLWFKQEDRTGASLFGVNGFHPPEIANASVYPNFDSCGNAEKYMLSYAEAGQSANNAMIVLDVKHGNITKRPLAALSLALDPTTGFAYMGDALGFISHLDDWTAPGAAGGALNMDFQSGYYNFARGSNQSIWALEFFLLTNGQNVTPSVYYDNGVASETLPAISTTSMMRVVRPLQNSVARKAQNISVRLNASSSAVNVSGTPQIIINSVKVMYDVRQGRARTGQ